MRVRTIAAAVILLIVLLTVALGTGQASSRLQGVDGTDPVRPPKVPEPLEQPRDDSTGEFNATGDDRAAVAPIRAVLLRGWSGCSSGSVLWQSLNDTWSSYGNIPIFIDYNYTALCDGRLITYSNLVNSRADVLIISNTGAYAFTQDETDALRRYVNEGHNIIGTFLIFEWSGIKNLALHPIFGIRSNLDFYDGINQITPSFNIHEPSHPLFKNIKSPYVTAGYPYPQTPFDLVWNSNDLGGARYMARTADSQGAITLYETAAYKAVYHSMFAEYDSGGTGGGITDKQFFYNAITLPRMQSRLPVLFKNRCLGFVSVAEQEHNDNPAQANGSICSGRQHTGSIYDTNESLPNQNTEDWFYFPWNGQGQVTVEVTSFPAEAGVFLYRDPGQSSLASKVNQAGVYTFTYNGTGQAGIYYVRLYVGGAVRPVGAPDYTLKITY